MESQRPEKAPFLIRVIGQLIMRMIGWKVDAGDVYNYPKSVIIGAPHTTNWDGLLAVGAIGVLNIKALFTIKDWWIKKPIIGPVIRWLGGYPIERSRSHNLVDQLVDAFNSHKSFVFAFAPEGTRKYTDYWKTGFYYVALEAGVPIIPAKVDYKNKVVWLGKALIPTGDIEADLAQLREYYRDAHPKYPQSAAPIRVRPREQKGNPAT